MSVDISSLGISYGTPQSAASIQSVLNNPANYDVSITGELILAPTGNIVIDSNPNLVVVGNGAIRRPAPIQGGVFMQSGIRWEGPDVLGMIFGIGSPGYTFRQSSVEGYIDITVPDVVIEYSAITSINAGGLGATAPVRFGRSAKGSSRCKVRYNTVDNDYAPEMIVFDSFGAETCVRTGYIAAKDNNEATLTPSYYYGDGQSDSALVGAYLLVSSGAAAGRYYRVLEVNGAELVLDTSEFTVDDSIAVNDLVTIHFGFVDNEVHSNNLVRTTGAGIALFGSCIGNKIYSNNGGGYDMGVIMDHRLYDGRVLYAINANNHWHDNDAEGFLALTRIYKSNEDGEDYTEGSFLLKPSDLPYLILSRGLRMENNGMAGGNTPYVNDYLDVGWVEDVLPLTTYVNLADPPVYPDGFDENSETVVTWAVGSPSLGSSSSAIFPASSTPLGLAPGGSSIVGQRQAALVAASTSLAITTGASAISADVATSVALTAEQTALGFVTGAAEISVTAPALSVTLSADPAGLVITAGSAAITATQMGRGIRAPDGTPLTVRSLSGQTLNVKTLSNGQWV